MSDDEGFIRGAGRVFIDGVELPDVAVDFTKFKVERKGTFKTTAVNEAWIENLYAISDMKIDPPFMPMTWTLDVTHHFVPSWERPRARSLRQLWQTIKDIFRASYREANGTLATSEWIRFDNMVLDADSKFEYRARSHHWRG